MLRRYRWLLLGIPPLLTVVMLDVSITLSDMMASRQWLIPTLFFLVFPVLLACLSAVELSRWLVSRSVVAQVLIVILETGIALMLWGELLLAKNPSWR